MLLNVLVVNLARIFKTNNVYSHAQADFIKV